MRWSYPSDAQVPAQSDYLTDGRLGGSFWEKRTMDLRHASPKHLILPGSAAGSVVQALRHLGPTRADDVVRIAARSLPAADKKKLAASGAGLDAVDASSDYGRPTY